MIHIQSDESDDTRDGLRMVCGIGPDLPEGDRYLFPGIVADADADCPGCNPTPRQIGTPLSQLSGRPGEPGYAAFCRIARSWGYD